MVGEQGDPDADAGVQRDVLQGERLGQGRAQLDGDIGGLVVAGVLEQYRELVPAQACQHVAVAQVLAQAGAHLDQQLVPGVVAQAVIDFLELVQVEHQQGVAAALRFRQARVPLGVQGPPVRQPGQLVGGCRQPA